MISKLVLLYFVVCVQLYNFDMLLWICYVFLALVFCSVDGSHLLLCIFMDLGAYIALHESPDEWLRYVTGQFHVFPLRNKFLWLP